MVQVVPDSKRIRITSEGDMLVQLIIVLNHSMCVTMVLSFFTQKHSKYSMEVLSQWS